MKMQNAEMEFVTFDARDVITASGGDAFWFTASDFTMPSGENLSAANTCFKNTYYNLFPRDANNGALKGVALDKSCQLVCEQNSINRSTSEYKDYCAYVVAEETGNPTGTKITTWQGILDWITAYDNQ